MIYLLRVNICEWKMEDWVEEDIKLWCISDNSLAKKRGIWGKSLPIRVSGIEPKWLGFYNLVWLSDYMWVPQEACAIGQGSLLRWGWLWRSWLLGAVWDPIASSWATGLFWRGIKVLPRHVCFRHSTQHVVSLSQILSSLMGSKTIISPPIHT